MKGKLVVPLGSVLELPCAECGSRLILRPKPSAWNGNSRVVYRCEKASCKGLLGAHADGRPMGTPADAETRRARRLTHQLLDSLWKEAWRVYKLREVGKEMERAKRAIGVKARTRTYAWLAHQLGIPVDQCHVALMDLPRLRLAYAALKRTSFHEIREWAKAREGSA